MAEGVPARVGVILAGGRARRMGRPKGGVILRGRPLVEHVADAMRAAGLEPVVVTKPGVTAPAPAGCRVLVEPDEPVHALAGIAHALATLGQPVVVCPCDMPLIPPGLLALLAAGDDGGDACVVEHGGGVQPLVGRYAPEALASVRAAIREEQSARGLIRDLGPRAGVVPHDALAAFGDPDAFMRDVDTPEDLRRMDAEGEIAPDALAAALAGAAPPTLVDVREPWEWEARRIAGAANAPLGGLPGGLERAAGPVVTVCATGRRSATAADVLRGAGVADVRSLAGGVDAWVAAGLPVAERADPLARYRRQTVLTDVGEAGQGRLRDARVLVVGAGGLGSPVALYLAAAGVGTLGLADDDRVEVSNLQRQVLHATDREGWPKIASATHALGALNPDVAVVPHDVRVGAAVAADLVAAYDAVVDASDNLDTRYALNAACVAAGVPLVWASVVGFAGQAGVVLPGRGPCYACVFPRAPDPGVLPGCADAGVLGATCGIVGSVQAIETLKLLVGVDAGLAGRLLMIDARAMEFHDIDVPRAPACPVCGPGT